MNEPAPWWETTEPLTRNLFIAVTEDQAMKCAAWMQGEEPMSLMEAIQAAFNQGVEKLDMSKVSKLDEEMFMRPHSSGRVGWRR